jgi:fumarate reductase subunit D
MSRMRTTAYHRDTLWLAAMVHRVSGVLLACFLPVHFLALGLALEGEARLQSFLAFTSHPIVKAAEIGLVFLLAVHLLGGLRVLSVEAMRYRDRQLGYARGALGVSLGLSVVFFLFAVLT